MLSGTGRIALPKLKKNIGQTNNRVSHDGHTTNYYIKVAQLLEALKKP